MTVIESPQTMLGSLRRKASKSGPAVLSQQDEVVATAMSRNALDRERFEFIVKVNRMLAVALCITCSGLVYLSLQPRETRYIFTDPEGGTREFVPEDRAIQSSVEVLNWATKAISTSLTMSFASYDSQMTDGRQYFTDAGWRGYEEALTRNGVLTKIISEKLATTAVPRSAPVIVWQGIGRSGRYGWRIQVPVNVSYASASGEANTTYNVELVVSRRPETEHPSGLGIEQFVAR
jgi:intracellular multiplication protein IcmL